MQVVNGMDDLYVPIYANGDSGLMRSTDCFASGRRYIEYVGMDSRVVELDMHPSSVQFRNAARVENWQIAAYGGTALLLFPPWLHFLSKIQVMSMVFWDWMQLSVERNL